MYYVRVAGPCCVHAKHYIHNFISLHSQVQLSVETKHTKCCPCKIKLLLMLLLLLYSGGPALSVRVASDHLKAKDVMASNSTIKVSCITYWYTRHHRPQTSASEHGIIMAQTRFTASLNDIHLTPVL
jgi:hypothetical protein